MANESDTGTRSTSKWKKGISILRKQSTVSEPSLASVSASIMEEETTEAELDTYLSKLKNRSGLKNLWSGKSFGGIVERDGISDVDIEGDISIDKTNLKMFNLDSDEEDLKKFIHDLSSDEGTPVACNSSVQEDDDAPFKLMDNIQFAELNIAYDGLDVSETERKENGDDFLPQLQILPQFSEIQLDSEADSLKHVSFKMENVHLFNQHSIPNNEINNTHDPGREVDKSISIRNSSVVKNQHSLRNSSPPHGSDYEDIDEIPEEFDDSRARTPAKSNDINYTESNFETLTEVEQHRTIGHKSRTAELTESSIATSDIDSLALETTYSSSSMNMSRKSKSKQKKSSSRKKSKSKTKRISHSQDLNNLLCNSPCLNNKSDNMSERTTYKLHYNNACTQTDTSNMPLGWAISGPQLGREYLDPTPIATHIVSPDSIEAITSFNPSILALNDMLRYQLQLTRQFIDNSWRLHKAYSEGPSSNYRYTTLDNTMKYIHKHAPKVISYEDALKEVKDQTS